MNCRTCNFPHPAFELYDGLCLRCVGLERDDYRRRALRVPAEGLDAAKGDSEPSEAVKKPDSAA